MDEQASSADLPVSFWGRMQQVQGILLAISGAIIGILLMAIGYFIALEDSNVSTRLTTLDHGVGEIKALLGKLEERDKARKEQIDELKNKFNFGYQSTLGKRLSNIERLLEFQAEQHAIPQQYRIRQEE